MSKSAMLNLKYTAVYSRCLKVAVLNLKYTAVYYAHTSMIKFYLYIRHGKVLRDL